jgi:hypothetical protein
MTRTNDIIRMAREADIDWHKHWNDDESNRLEVFAALVAVAEREAVCRIVTGLCISDNNAEEINRAIRARGQDPMPLFDDWGSWKK